MNCHSFEVGILQLKFETQTVLLRESAMNAVCGIFYIGRCCMVNEVSAVKIWDI